MRRTKKILLAALSFVLAASAFAGCKDKRGSADVTPFVNDYDPNKEYNISFFGWGDDKEQNIYRLVIQDFERLHPNINVSYEGIAAGEYLNALTGKINNLPDVFYLPDTEFLQWVDSGRLLNLLGPDGVDEDKLSDIWDNAVNEYYYNPSTFTLGKSAGGGVCLRFPRIRDRILSDITRRLYKRR